jgi:DinB superfamily
MPTVLVNDIQPAIALLEKTPFLFETLLRDLPADVLQWKPWPDRWSISEVLAHLADIEQVYAERVRRIMAEDSPELKKYDETTSAGGDYSRVLRLSIWRASPQVDVRPSRFSQASPPQVAPG